MSKMKRPSCFLISPRTMSWYAGALKSASPTGSRTTVVVATAAALLESLGGARTCGPLGVVVGPNWGPEAEGLVGLFAQPLAATVEASAARANARRWVRARVIGNMGRSSKLRLAGPRRGPPRPLFTNAQLGPEPARGFGLGGEPREHGAPFTRSNTSA